ncbi:unnamed protein product [Paramecium pentaurelia]|uniref:Uncharacterized protein n=1 Tax=Paramecium pentaurelia TaxID=43138 RepID=A0A8S1WE77_9CILI|nr:unnamed protein product [Paramecium pentaurelia]
MDFDLNQVDCQLKLDNVIGVPQRAMQKTKKYNNQYVKNQVVRTKVESFNFAGNLLKVQAYFNSDRYSFTHPQLAYWDRVPEELIYKIATYFQNNHPQKKYMLYIQALMGRRCDQDFSKQEVGLDSTNPYFQAIQKEEKL